MVMQSGCKVDVGEQPPCARQQWTRGARFGEECGVAVRRRAHKRIRCGALNYKNSSFLGVIGVISIRIKAIETV